MNGGAGVSRRFKFGGHMKKFLTLFAVVIMALGATLPSAEAKRLGGGGSFGKSSPTFSRQAPMQNANQAAAAPRPAAPAPASPWKGIVGGALLGLGIGALMSHFGMGGALGSMLGGVLMIGLLAVAAMFLFRFLSRKSAGSSAQPAYAGMPNGPMERSTTPEIGANLGYGGNASGGAIGLPESSTAIPADFDTPGFLRHAKTQFIRLQAAWDKADVNDIREFATPEMFGELKLQLTERGASANHTDVVSIDAELLGIETNSVEHVASVRFHGMIREAEHAPTESFNEIWVLTKPISGGGWLLAGVQQA